jgi:hypothetical protein
MTTAIDPKTLNCGLYYKPITTINDDYSHQYDAPRWGITYHIILMTLEVSFMLLDNIYSTGLTHDCQNIFMVQAVNTKGGSITVPLTCLTGLESAV